MNAWSWCSWLACSCAKVLLGIHGIMGHPLLGETQSLLIHTHPSTLNHGHVSHQQTLRDIKGLCHPRKTRWFPSEWPATRHVDQGGSRWWRCSRKPTMSSSPRVRSDSCTSVMLQLQSGKCEGGMDGKRNNGHFQGSNPYWTVKPGHRTDFHICQKRQEVWGLIVRRPAYQCGIPASWGEQKKWS